MHRKQGFVPALGLIALAAACSGVAYLMQRREALEQQRAVPRISHIVISHGDITKQNVDAIVNAANERLKAGGGVCGAIFEAASPEADKLQHACFQALKNKKWAYCPTGQAVVTPSFGALKKQGIMHIVHAVGPKSEVRGAKMSDAQKKALYNAYTNSLLTAEGLKLQSVAFPLISAGIFGCDKSDAMHVAAKAMSDYFIAHPLSSIKLVKFVFRDANDCTRFLKIGNYFQKLPATIILDNK